MEILSSYVPIEILELILKKSSFNGIVLSISWIGFNGEIFLLAFFT